MKHKTWFRLVLKAIGVLLIGLSLPTIGALLGVIVTTLMDGSSLSMMGGGYLWTQVLYYGFGLVQVGFGLYLFFGGECIVNRAIPSNRDYCPDCGYDLSNSKAARCSECGCTLPPTDQSNPQ